MYITRRDDSNIGVGLSFIHLILVLVSRSVGSDIRSWKHATEFVLALNISFCAFYQNKLTRSYCLDQFIMFV